MATFGAMSPANLRLGLGESERVAFVAALTQRPDLTEATLPATLVKACLPSEKVQATLTLGDLIKGEAHNVSALTQNLRAAILGDW